MSFMIPISNSHFYPEKFALAGRFTFSFLHFPTYTDTQHAYQAKVNTTNRRLRMSVSPTKSLRLCHHLSAFHFDDTYKRPPARFSNAYQPNATTFNGENRGGDCERSSTGGFGYDLSRFSKPSNAGSGNYNGRTRTYLGQQSPLCSIALIYVPNAPNSGLSQVLIIFNKSLYLPLCTYARN